MTCVGGELYLKIHAYMGICMCCVGARVLLVKIGETSDSSGERHFGGLGKMAVTTVK